MVDEDGSVAVVALADLDGDGELDLAVFEGVQSGLLDDDDVAQSAALVQPGQRSRPAALREHLGRPVRHRDAERRCRGHRKRPDPGRRRRRSARRARGRGSLRGGARHGTDRWNGPHGRRRRHRDRGVEPGVATSGRPLADQQADAEAYQEQQYQQPPPQQVVYAAPPPAAPPRRVSDDLIEQLQKLGALRDQGILTDAEFEAQKAKLLAA